MAKKAFKKIEDTSLSTLLKSFFVILKSAKFGIVRKLCQVRGQVGESVPSVKNRCYFFF